MKHWRLVAIGLAGYAATVVATVPATVIDLGLQRLSDGKLRLVGAQGSLWSGAGQIEMRDAAGRASAVKSFAWQVLPESLVRGHLLVDVALDRAIRPFPVTLSLSGIALADADVVLPVAVLGLGVPALVPLGLTGDVSLRVANFSIERQQILGHATLQWRQAGSVLTPIAPLGDYEVTLDGKGPAVAVSLATLQGPLQLDGSGVWSRGAALDFLASARVPPQHRQQLDPLLRLIAVESGPGSFALQLR